MDAEHGAPRRRLAPAQRREEILLAAEQAFASAPYADVTMAQIADAAQASEALAFRYFPSKGALYAEVVGRALARLGERQREAVAAAPAGMPVREVLRTTTRLYLDFVTAHAANWSARASAGEPEEASAVRVRARGAYVEGLRELLAPSDTARHTFAMWGFMGFIDAACDDWVRRGAPRHELEPLLDACLGALEGALGDWAA